MPAEPEPDVPAGSSASRDGLIWVGWTALLILLVKALLHAEDPDFFFYIGDSNEYLRSAGEGYFPPGRSWLYGRIVGWLTLPDAGPGAVVAAQTLASGLGALVLGAIARWGLGAPGWLAGAAALVSAASPFALLYERTLLTEAFGLYWFVLFLGAAVAYLRTYQLVWVAVMAILGVPCLAMRLAFLPLVVFAAVAVPFVAWWARRDVGVKQRRLGVVAGVLVGLAATVFTHAGYKVLTGKAAGQPPAYQYQDGWYLLVAGSPALRPEHGASEEMGEVIAKVGVPLDREHRTEQMWREDGLRYQGYLAFGELEGNRLARATALRVFLSRPFKMAANSFRNLAVYWTATGREAAMKEDLNSMFYADDPNAMNPEYPQRVEQLYGIDNLPEITARRTLTKRYFLAAAPAWSCALTLAAPLLFLLSLLRPYAIPAPRAVIFLAIVALAYLGLVLALTLVESFRLLYPIEPAFLLGLAGVLASLFRSRVATAG